MAADHNQSDYQIRKIEGNFLGYLSICILYNEHLMAMKWSWVEEKVTAYLNLHMAEIL